MLVLGRVAKGLKCCPAVLVVLRVDDLVSVKSEHLVELEVRRRPGLSPPQGHEEGLPGAGDHLCASVARLLVSDLLDPVLEDRPGLIRSVSARRSSPPEMAPGNAAPLEIRRQKSDKWLNVAGKRGVESRLYLIRMGHRTSASDPKIPEPARSYS